VHLHGGILLQVKNVLDISRGLGDNVLDPAAGVRIGLAKNAAHGASLRFEISAP